MREMGRMGRLVVIISTSSAPRRASPALPFAAASARPVRSAPRLPFRSPPSPTPPPPLPPRLGFVSPSPLSPPRVGNSCVIEGCGWSLHCACELAALCHVSYLNQLSPAAPVQVRHSFWQTWGPVFLSLIYIVSPLDIIPGV